MSREQKLIRIGMLEEKKRELAQIINSLKSRINSISLTIMPEMDIVDQKFDQAKILIEECVALKKQYLELSAAVVELEESL